MMGAPAPRPERVSRRHVLALLGLGAAGAGQLVGCASDRSNPGNSEGGRDFAGAYPYQLPPKGHFNVMAGVTDAIAIGIYLDLIFLPGAMYYWEEDAWEKLVGDEWSFDETAKTFTYTIKSGLTWSDGSPITSKDVTSTFWCRWVMRQSEWAFIEAMEATDDQTVVFTMNNPSTVVERSVVRTNILPDAMYGEFAGRAQDLFEAGKSLDDAEGTQLNKDLQAYRPENDEVLTSGPFRYDFASMTNAQLTLTKNPKGLAADIVGFDRITIYNGEASTAISPLILRKDIDYADYGFTVAEVKQFERQNIRIVRAPLYSGPAVLFNLAKLREFGDPRARRALAHATDRNANGEVALGESGVGVKLLTGMSDLRVPDWLDDDQRARLDPYELDLDKAAALLEEAGWTRQNNAWQKPDGTRAEYELIYPSEWADWATSGDNLSRQLTQFGITVKGRGVTANQQPIDVDKGNFDLAIQGWGTSSHPHPHFSFVTNLFVHNIPVAANQGGKGMGFALTQDTTAFGRVDLEQLVNAAGEGLDEEQQRESVAKVAIVFNELLPMIPLWERYGNGPALEGVRVRRWPADDDPIMRNGAGDDLMVMLMLTGRLDPL
jgi:peptide/nickel transport system substrate-binding protein